MKKFLPVLAVFFLAGCLGANVSRPQARQLTGPYQGLNVYNPDGTLKAGNITFVYIPAPGEGGGTGIETVYVAGYFNGFRLGDTNFYMSRDEYGNFRLVVPLGAGTYGYSFVIDDSDWLDMDRVAGRMLPEPSGYSADSFEHDNALIVVE